MMMMMMMTIMRRRRRRRRLGCQNSRMHCRLAAMAGYRVRP